MKNTMRFLVMTLALSTATLSVVSMTGCSGSSKSRSTGEYLDDKSIGARVKSALYADPNVSGFQVNVDTFDRVVQLNGFVDTPAQKTRAEEIARNVHGVREVRNNLSVREAIRGNENRPTTNPAPAPSTSSGG